MTISIIIITRAHRAISNQGHVVRGWHEIAADHHLPTYDHEPAHRLHAPSSTQGRKCWERFRSQQL